MSRPIFFDLDGTLTDPGEGITRCIQHALRAMARTAPPREELFSCIGPPLGDSFVRLLDTKEKATIDRAIEHYRERYKAKGMLENQIYPGIREELGKLQQAGRRLWVVTSKPAIYAEQIVRHFGLSELFQGIHGPDMKGNRSDKTELIAHVLETEELSTGAPPVMIGDRSYDMIGARANGLRAIGVTWGYGSREELEQAGAHTILTEVAQLGTGLE